MVPLQNFATAVIAEMIRRQPPSPGRTTFAWTVAAGPALARSATVMLVDQVLYVRTRDARWAAEIERLKSTILPRMQHLLGAGSVLGMEVTSA